MEKILMKRETVFSDIPPEGAILLASNKLREPNLGKTVQEFNITIPPQFEQVDPDALYSIEAGTIEGSRKLDLKFKGVSGLALQKGFTVFGRIE